MAWKPDLAWSARVLRAFVNPNDLNVDNRALRDPANVSMAARFAYEELDKLLVQASQSPDYERARPVVTTLCGSSRFPDLHAHAMMALTLQGRIVVPLGCYGHADVPLGARFLTSDGDENTPEKQRLDGLHFRKIEMSDGIYVVNPGGYVGSSTRREIEHARSLNKTVEFMFQEVAP